MLPTAQGSWRLFQLAGIQVYLHWLWFVVAVWQISARSEEYSSLVWNALEYVGLFGLVLLHEFGHALACRQTGGRADQIVLWPLGGVAFVSPPQRPGAILWSIVAGPLVNVVLVPVLLGLLFLSRALGLPDMLPDAHNCLRAVAIINFILLAFNLLPFYPLDGGQILRSLLWFVIGRAKSLLVASALGFVGVAGLIGLALYLRSVWFGILAFFVLMNCWRGLRESWYLARLARLPRHANGMACPSCRTAPPQGAWGACGQCGNRFDPFETIGTCPGCGARFEEIRCLDCGATGPLRDWVPVVLVSPRW